jgi:hypothetical protein
LACGARIGVRRTFHNQTLNGFVDFLGKDAVTIVDQEPVYLKRIEKTDGTVVTKFTPMNLRWTNTEIATRKVLLKELPILCDFIHVSDPTYRSQHGEDLIDVPAGKAIMCLDVEATNTAKGHLLGPGAYRFFLYLAAENSPARDFTVEVRFDGTWHVNQDQMFDQEMITQLPTRSRIARKRSPLN